MSADLPRSTPITTRRVVTVSLLVDVVDVLTCLVVAWFTHSAVVFAEMAQGFADVIGSGLLVIGERRARRPRDAEHPLGYQREVFFWALLSSLAMLVLGAGLSFARGYSQLVEPQPIERIGLAYGVLALSVATNAYTVLLSVRKLRHEQHDLVLAIREVSRPLVKTALLRDAAGTLSAVLGLVALASYSLTGQVLLDAVGAIVVAVLMVVFSVLLLSQTRALIVGRAIPSAGLDAIRDAVQAMPGVQTLNRLTAVYVGAKDVAVELDLELQDRLTTTEIEVLLDRVQARVRIIVPEAREVRVDLNPAG